MLRRPHGTAAEYRGQRAQHEERRVVQRACTAAINLVRIIDRGQSIDGTAGRPLMALMGGLSVRALCWSGWLGEALVNDFF